MQSYTLSEVEFEAVRTFARRFAGIALPSSKQSLVVGRWSRRLAHYGFNTFSQYLGLLGHASGADEVQVAVDLLTTNETYFFREERHFEFIREHVLTKIRRGSGFRVWSAACSTGEEPYSIAMLLADVLGDSPWEVIGSDISSAVLATARAGHYDLVRTEKIPPAYMQRFCLRGTGPYDGTFLIDRPLRQRVRFEQINLNETLPNIGRFDLILLRNVMIYFDAPTKSSVLTRLIPTLRGGGHFLVGHCETLNGVTSELQMLSASIYKKPERAGRQ